MTVNPYSGLLRLSGLSSGLDVDGIVEKLMTVQRIPVDRANQKKQIISWRQDMMRDINTKLTALRDAAFNLKLEGSFKTFDAASSDSSVLTATASSTAVQGSYSVIVNNLASAAKMESNTTVSQPLQSTADITGFGTTFDLSGTSFVIAVNGVKKTISWGTGEGNYADMSSLVSGLQAKVNDAFGTNQVSITTGEPGSPNQLILKSAQPSAQQLITVSNPSTGTSSLPQLNLTDNARSQIDLDAQLKDLVFKTGTLTFASDKLNFTINGKSFSVDKTTTLRQLINTVNNDSNANVTLSYDSTKDIFVLARKDSGAGKNISISDGAGGNLTSILSPGVLQPGQNSKITVNGNVVEQSSNSVTFQGITFNLLKQDAAAKTVTISQDVDAVFNNIKSFVEAYNDAINLINTKLSEKHYRDYPPLTDEQKKDMKESDITLWQDKAKSGLLSSDPMLSTIVNSMRQSVSSAVNGVNLDFRQMSQIGITTVTYSEKGKLYIDEAKLKASIASNNEDVMKFFNNTPSPLVGSGLAGVVNLDGKDFKMTFNGSQETISLQGSYDLGTALGKYSFVNSVKVKLDAAFGTGNVSVVLGADLKLSFISKYGQSMTLNSGTTDALADIGFTDGAKFDSSNSGIAVKLYDGMRIGISSILEKAGASGSLIDSSILGKEAKRIDKQISNLNDHLAKLQERYYRQFTAMETALNKLNSQSAWLTQQLGNQG